MPNIEYYYPLVSMTAKNGVSGKIYFDCASNKQINFASEQDISGNAISYHIQPINISDQTDDGPMYFKDSDNAGNPATNYLVIKHWILHSGVWWQRSRRFNVAFPLITIKTNISKYTKPGRMNEQLSKSIDNLINVNLGQTIQFSLEHVIDSMKSFNPNSYYELTTTTSSPSVKTYVMKAPIYISTTIDATKFEPSLEIPPISTTSATSTTPLIPATPETSATITRVIKTSNCTKNKLTEVVTPNKLFYFLTRKEQTRINYLNIIYSIGYFFFVIFFYHIYTKYLIVMNPNIRTTISLIICVMLLIIVFPIKFTKETKKNRSALQHGMIFARYSVLGFAVLLSIMFGKSAFEFINNVRNNGLGGLDGAKYLWSRINANRLLSFAWIVIISLFIWSAILTFTQMKI